MTLLPLLLLASLLPEMISSRVAHMKFDQTTSGEIDMHNAYFSLRENAAYVLITCLL